ncbi:hypothetical protein PI125_g10513 [Phytophthora idaei]|nr:hypothetical protein PI125_g10513 [Phytophthora idaei]
MSADSPVPSDSAPQHLVPSLCEDEKEEHVEFYSSVISLG